VPTRRGTPTPDELVHWLSVARPVAARGTFRWSSNLPPGSKLTFRYAGRKPVPLFLPPNVEIAFWHAALDRWRLEVEGRLVGVSDGKTAVSWSDERAHVGSVLLAPSGPARLLTPEAERGPGRGTVEFDTVAGRPCWRWTAPQQTWWLAVDTGLALAYEDADLRAELLSLELLDALDDALFTVPVEAASLIRDPEPEDEWQPTTRPHAGPEDEPEPATADDTAPDDPFTVCWWPSASYGEPVDGDPTVPEVLLRLPADSGRRFWLGVTPLPRTAPTRRGARVRRWTGDGWAFALSWRGQVADGDIDRVIASVPRRWEP